MGEAMYSLQTKVKIKASLLFLIAQMVRLSKKKNSWILLLIVYLQCFVGEYGNPLAIPNGIVSHVCQK